MRGSRCDVDGDRLSGSAHPVSQFGVLSERRAAVTDGSDAPANLAALRPLHRLEAVAARSDAGAWPAPPHQATEMASPARALAVMARDDSNCARLLGRLDCQIWQAVGLRPSGGAASLERLRADRERPGSNAEQNIGEAAGGLLLRVSDRTYPINGFRKRLSASWESRSTPLCKRRASSTALLQSGGPAATAAASGRSHSTVGDHATLAAPTVALTSRRRASHAIAWPRLR